MNTKTIKRVQFSEIPTIEYTHSSSDYDRSCFADLPTTINIQQQQQQQQQQQTHMMMLPRQQALEQQAVKPKKNKFASSLRIDTTSLDGSGPLFFTALTTNYSCRSRHRYRGVGAFKNSMSLYSEDDEDSNGGYLTPVN